MALRYTYTYISIVVLLIMIAIPFPLISGGDGGPTREHLDIAISDISLSGRHGEHFFPGDTVTMILSIGHDNDPLPSDTPVGPQHGLKIVITIEHSIDNITTIYRDINSLPLNYTVERNSTYNPMMVNILWNASFSIETDVMFTARLVITDDDTSDNGIGIGPISFDHIRSDPLIWEEGQEDRNYESPAPHIVNVGDMARITFELQNNGGEIDTFEFIVISIPEGWNVSLGGPYTVFPNSDVPVDMFVKVSDNPFLAQADEEHVIYVKVRSIYEPNMTYSTPSVHGFRFEVRFKSSAELLPESDNVYLTPSQAHQVIFWLWNAGNGEDDYTLFASIDDVHARKGWKVAFESGTRQPTVKSDQYFKIIVRVTVPTDAPLNYAVILTLRLQSMKADYETFSDPCTIFAGVRHAAEIERIEEPFDVIPGEYNLINFNFTNEGNSRDSTLNLLISYKPRGWEIYINQTILSEGGGLGPRTTVPLKMSIFVNETTVSSDHGNLPFIKIQAKGSEFEYLLDEERYHFRIPLIRKVKLSCDLDRITGSPGEEVQFNFILENRGTWLDTFNVSIEGIDLVFDEDPTQLELAPAESFHFKAAFLIPIDWPADGDLSTPWTDNNSLFDPHILKLEARSQNETEINSSLMEHPFELFILPKYDLEIGVVDGPVWKVPYDHDQFRTFLVEVRNTGNSICRIDISLDTNYTWIDTVDEKIPLAFNEIRYIPIYLNYQAFEMNEYEAPSIDMEIVIAGTEAQQEFFYQEMKFQFLPYTFRIEIAEIINPSWMMDGSFLVFHGDNQTFKVLVVREGQPMYLPEEIDGPYVVMYIDGVERSRKEIPLMGPGNKTYLEFGPTQILLKGELDVEFAIEGMGSDSINGVSNWSLVLTSEDLKDPSSGNDKSSIIPVVIVILVMIIVMGMVGFGIYLYYQHLKKEDEEETSKEDTIGFHLKMNKN